MATEFTYTDPADLKPDMIILDDASANIASGSMNASSEYGMILPAVVFEMNRQSGDSSGDFGSLGGGPIDEPPDDEPPTMG